LETGEWFLDLHVKNLAADLIMKGANMTVKGDAGILFTCFKNTLII